MKNNLFSHKVMLRYVGCALVFIYILFRSYSGLPQLMMNMDEQEWIHRGMLYVDAGIIRHDFNDPIWNGYYSRDQSNLGEYLYGLWTYLIYRQNPITLMANTEYNQRWIEGPNSSEVDKLKLWWVKYAFIPNPLSVIPSTYHQAYQIIVTNRYLNTTFFIGTTIVLFLCAKSLFGLFPATLSSIFFINLPQNQIHSRQAMLGSIITFFFTLSLLIFTKQKGIIEKISYKLILLLGITIGLASSTRIDGFASLILAITILSIETFIFILKRNAIPKKKVVILNWMITTTTLILTSFSIFYVLTPYIWHRPIEKTIEMIQWRQSWTTILVDTIPTQAISSTGLQFYKVLSQMAIPYHSPKVIYLPYLEAINFSIGLLFIILKSKISSANQQYTRTLLWIIGLYIIMSSYIRIDLERYYLPILPLATLIHCAGITIIISHGKKLWHLSFHKSPPTTNASKKL